MIQSCSGHISPIDPGVSFAVESSTLVIADHSSIGSAAVDVAAVYDFAFTVMGSSVNPGGGMPMVILCGQNVTKKVVDSDRPSWSG